jgi:hypothetical protein
MPDLLVKLFELQDDWGFRHDQQRQGILIRKPIGPEKQLLIDWVRTGFGDGWASEMDVALCNRPISCFIAIKDDTPMGFACYDATALGFFGPIGITERYRGRGTGRALLMACLLDMRLKGYGYGIIGWAEPAGFYQKTVGAIEIPNDDTKPGVYRTMLKKETGKVMKSR